MIDWDTNITLTIGATFGWIAGTLSGIAWWWFPLVAVFFLIGSAVYDITKALVLGRRRAA